MGLIENKRRTKNGIDYEGDEDNTNGDIGFLKKHQSVSIDIQVNFRQTTKIPQRNLIISMYPPVQAMMMLLRNSLVILPHLWKEHDKTKNYHERL